MRCVECGTEIDLQDLVDDIVQCPVCGIDLEFFENRLFGLQIGLSEE